MNLGASNHLKGQYSTFMKPILVMIFGMLLVSILTSTLGFNIGLQQDRQSTEFQSSPVEVFSDISSCMSVKDTVSASDTVLNQTKLEQMEMKYLSREPECAQMFGSGYSVSVKQDFMKGVQTSRRRDPVDVVFALDDSGSMGSYLNQVKSNTRDFINSLPSGSRVGMFTYSTPPNDYIDNTVALTTDESKVVSELSSITTDGGDEPEDKAIKYTLNNFNFDSSSRKMLIILATEAATKDTPTSKSVTEWAQDAANQNIIIHTISENKGKYDDIAQITGGKRFSVNADYSSIFDQISSGERYTSGESTCITPPVRSYNSSAEIVVTSDASDGYGQEWETICDKVNNTVNKLEAQGLNTQVGYYVPGQPASASSGKGTPMQISGNDYSFGQNPNLPSCIDTSYNNATTSAYGKGVTEWNSTNLVDYNASMDYGLEAWGASSKWILENHNWNQSKDTRMMFVIGGQDPTGGNSSGENFRTETGTQLFDNETELVNNLTSLASRKNVTIHTLTDELEYSAKDVYGNPNKNDADELLRMAASGSGGERIIYDGTGNLADRFEEQFYKFSKQGNKNAGTCTNVEYSFGNTDISNQRTTESLVSIFPVSVRQSENLTTPAELRLRLVKNPLQRVAGTIQKAVSTGERFNENITVNSRITTEKEITVAQKQFTRKNRTVYGLRNTNGNEEIDVNDGLIVGVNGREVFKELDTGSSQIDFGDTSNQFKGYKGASLQVIGIHNSQPEMLLDSLELWCVNGCSGSNKQTINPSKIKAVQGSNRYQELGGLGAFYQNFTQINIGKKSTVSEEAACYSGTDKCVVLNHQNVDNLELEPGSHNLRVKYSPTQGVIFR
jgi:Mg-chelatase subunit ChlD